MNLAIRKAFQTGVAVVALVQSGHIGRLGHYVEMAAESGMISMIMGGGHCADSPRTAPFGGSKGVLDTNPVAMGMPSPAPEAANMMFDYATSTLSGVKVILAQKHGKQLPEGAILDKQGNPTTDPNAYFDGGTFTNFGGHKGYALSVVAQYLGQLFTDAENFVEEGRGGPIFSHQGVTMIVFRADLFQPLERFCQQAQQASERIRAVPATPGHPAVLVPGDPEARTRAQRQRDGIPIEDEIWNSVVEAAKSVGVQV